MPPAVVALRLACGLAGLSLAGHASAGEPRIHASRFEPFACQDGMRQEAEQCDDGNGDDFDGCSAQCRRVAACNAAARPGGDGFVLDPAGGRCYVVYESESTTWEAANRACVEQGGHLASLTDAAENSRIVPLLAGGARPWIGAGDELVEGEFLWLSAESFGYQNFGTGQPDGDGDCTYLSDAAGAWSDTDCGFLGLANARLCEFESP